MPGAVIAFDQARPGPSTSSGTPGVARKDLWQNREVTARSTAPGNISYSWAFLDIPPGSAAVLADASTANARFTPDLPGSYRVQLTTNGGGPGNVQILIAAVTFDNAGALTQRGWRLPAFGEVAGEDNFGGQLRGWAEAFEFILADTRTALAALSPPGANKQITFNDSGVYGADADFTFDKATDILNIAAAGVLRYGTTNVAGVGSVRFPTGARSIMRWRNAGNTQDLAALGIDVSDNLFIGTDSAFTSAQMPPGIRMRAATSVYFGVGANSYFELEGGIISLKQPEVYNKGTADGEARTRETSLQTTDSAAHTLSSYVLPNNSMSIADIEVLAVRADGALGVWWKKSKSHLNDAGVVTQGTVRDVDSEAVGGAMPSWTVAFDVSGSSARVRVNSQGDNVTWYIVRQGLAVVAV